MLLFASMIVVADSGSTKCDWLIIDGNKRQLVNTIGINPFFHSSDDLLEALVNNFPTELISEIKDVYFYGAGCSSPSLKNIIEGGLMKFFTSAQTIMVEHDMVGAAKATTPNEECIACILGTGSNSVYWDGQNAHEVIPSLAYILGDEGSGSYLGKQLLRAFFYKELPQEIENHFINHFGFDKNIILENIYQKPHANVYLASFMPFIKEFASYDFINKMIYNAFSQFAKYHICCYSNYKKVKVNFVGSVAFLFQEILQEVAQDYGFQLGKIVRKPVDALGYYHSNKISS